MVNVLMAKSGTLFYRNDENDLSDDSSINLRSLENTRKAITI